MWDELAQETGDACFAAFGRGVAYQAGGYGPGLTVTVIPLVQEHEVLLDGAALERDGQVYEVRLSEVAEPKKGDVITLNDGARLIVQGRPALDEEGLVWRLDVRPHGAAC